MTHESDTHGAAAGWIAFAAVMLMLIGFFHAVTGLSGVIGREIHFLPVVYLADLDVTTWGWVHLVTGIVVFLAGLGLLRGAIWARILGVGVAGLSALINFAWLPLHPLWSIVMITVSVFVIWALTVQGQALARRRT